MKYRVEAQTVGGCQCDDCTAGKHLYELQRWEDGEWRFVGVSLQSYASADECKRNHCWGIEFHPDDVWEDGTPVAPPEPRVNPTSGTVGRVPLDVDAFMKSVEALKGHWGPMRGER